MPTRNFAKLLMSKGLVTQTEVNEALAQQQKSGRKIGEILIEQGVLTEEALWEALAEYAHVPLFDLKNYDYVPELSKLLPEKVARQFQALVLAESGKTLTVGMVNPADLAATDEIKKLINRPIQLAMLKPDDFQRILDKVYRRTDDIKSYAKALQSELGKKTIVKEDTSRFKDDTTVTRLLQSIFRDAVQVGASDIHIEPAEDTLRIRLRVDGVLQEQVLQHKEIADALVVRLKLMADLDIAEKRVPQDGRLQFDSRLRFGTQAQEYDVRLSTMPTQYGETVVMRILDKTTGLKSLADLGMQPAQLRQFNQWLGISHGIIIVTGPTGSGKTTTLYSALQKLNTPERKIITVEDPVEYHLDGVNQVQVNNKIDLTFARVLRSTLRHDPDILLVGEIRDNETAQIAVRAALTGHLVLTTLHTTNSASTAVRLIDMGIEPFLVAAVLRGVLAQRLVRKNCPHCVKPHELTELETFWLSGTLDMSQAEIDQFSVQQGVGCANCNHTGYIGRLGIYELLNFDETMHKAIRVNDQTAFNAVVRERLKGETLLDQGMKLVASAKTSLAEIMRVLGG